MPADHGERAGLANIPQDVRELLETDPSLGVLAFRLPRTERTRLTHWIRPCRRFWWVVLVRPSQEPEAAFAARVREQFPAARRDHRRLLWLRPVLPEEERL